MKVWRALAGALLLVVVMMGRPCLGAQGSGCMPVSGTYTGVAYTTLLNSALAALISTNSGSSAPHTDCSGVSVIGQQWYDTSKSRPALRIYDGGMPLSIGIVDPSNHVWEPQVGGGLGSLTAASTTDLCGTSENYLAISGNGPINSFGASCALGQIKALNFTAAATIVFGSSSIVLPTGASIVSQPGDQALAIYSGAGVWVVLAYTRADGTALTATVVPPVHYAGQTILMRMPTCPAGSLAEDGSAISRAGNPQLFLQIGTTWGAGDGSTTFNLPNSGGQFDRGWINGQIVDSGRVFGSTQLDALQDHGHGYTYSQTNTTNQSSGSGCCGAQSPSTRSNVTSGVSGARASSAETRPINITAYHCIFTANSP